MGMFDEYQPIPPLDCPACNAFLRGWQGKDGPCALFVWRQGVAAPIYQMIEDDDVRLTDEQLAEWRLPEEFTIYTTCCSGFFIEADCYCTDGVWTRTELLTAEHAVQRKNERRGEFKARLRWLRGEFSPRK